MFISHASSDDDAARAFVGALEKIGVECWLASRDVPVGANYAAEIMAAMSSAATVVVILSDDSLASPHVRREVNHAIGQGKSILPFTVQADARGP
ncbi:MAG: toll/interleukin-1 receptor domain-containing protein, partial [Actinobacteria bacterium]|nr:toll/interleukin-1 receptor domain-containing protein [Actinomycetota bacterium]